MSSPWSCPVCTYRNDGSCSHCNVCEQPKSELEHSTIGLGRSRSEDDSRLHSRHDSRERRWALARTGAVISSDGLDFRDGEDSTGATRVPEGGGRRRSLVAELSEYVADSSVPSLLNDALAGFVTASFGFAGATVGAVAGALAGRATNSGIVRGAGLGALAGAIVCVEALEASRSYLSSIRASYSSSPQEQQGLPPAERVGLRQGVDNHVAFVSAAAVGGMTGFLFQGLERRDGSYEDFFLELPVYTFSSRSTPEKCPICLEFPREGEVMRLLPQCQHTFHKDCIDRWLYRRQFTCPVCRQFVIG